jgi:hypothetical protein
MRGKLIALALGLLALLGGGPLRAGPSYQFVFDQSNYTVSPNGTVTVGVGLQETFNPQTDTPVLAPGTDGLVGAGVQVQTVSPFPTMPAQVKSLAAISGNSAFSAAFVPQLPVPGTTNSPGLVELAFPPVFGTVTFSSPTLETDVVPLGTFTFTAGSVVGEVTNLLALNTTLDPSMPSSNNVTLSGIVLDPLIAAGTATITVVASPVIPEPSGLALVLVAIAGAAGRRLRRPRI